MTDETTEEEKRAGTVIMSVNVSTNVSAMSERLLYGEMTKRLDRDMMIPLLEIQPVMALHGHPRTNLVFLALLMQQYNSSQLVVRQIL